MSNYDSWLEDVGIGETKPDDSDEYEAYEEHLWEEENDR